MLTKSLAIAAFLAAPLAAQDKPAKGDPQAVDRAIDRGIASLKQKAVNRQDTEIVLWTLLHAGVPEADPAFQKLLKTALEEPIWKSSKEFTYNMVLLAMCLQKLDAARYQPVIAQVGQFLADTQCETGQWAYGESFKPSTAFDRKPLPTKTAKTGKTESLPTVRIKRNPAHGETEKEGDNSNSQYAALGLRACHDAGVELPEEVLRRARAWWEKDQQKDGSWNYGEKQAEKGYGSMTCGAIGAIAILDSLLKQSLQKDASISKGFDWLGKNFSVTENPHAGKDTHLYYYLYSLERAGNLTGTDAAGAHDWYQEGARELLKAQKPDGSWKGPAQETETWSTCFAILFLKRATRPLPSVKSVDERVKPATDPKKE